MNRRRHTGTVLAAVGARISSSGDMPIRVSWRTMRVLMDALGLHDWDEGQEAFREVDALALDMIRHLARS